MSPLKARQNRPWRFVAAAITALMIGFAAIGGIQVREINNLKSLGSAGEDNIAWAFYQLMLEHVRLGNALYMISDNPVDGTAYRDVQLRYDIFASRVDIIQAPTYRNAIEADTAARGHLAHLVTFLADVDPVFDKDTLTADEITMLVGKVDELTTSIHALGLAAKEYAVRSASSRTVEIRGQIVTMATITIALFLTITGLTTVGLHQYLTLERRGVALEKAKAEAEDASRAKDAFLAIASHELRTPLTGLIGMVDHLADDSMSPEELARTVSMLRRSGQSLSRVVDDILDYSRLAAGHVSLHPGQVRPAEIISAVVETFRAQARDKGVALVVEPMSGQPAPVLLDDGRLRQILSNVVSNAIKYTDTGSVTISMDQTEESLSVIVKDTGDGLSARDLEVIGEPFRRGENARRKGIPGTGLGLGICYNLARAMGGSLHLNSVEGGGTTVHLTLPVTPAAEDQSEHAEVRVKLAPRRILVVEDDPVIRSLLEMRLTSEGHTVSTAENGLAGLDAVQAKSFDLVLMDMQMPVMDGCEALCRLRVLPGAVAQTPVIALSAHVGEEMRTACMASGFSEFVCKPIDWALLIRRISQVTPGFPDGKQAGEQRLVADSDAYSMTWADSLMETLGKDAVVKLLKPLPDRLEALVGDLDRVAIDQDDEAVRAFAHRLTGLASQFGASALGREANRIQRGGLDAYQSNRDAFRRLAAATGDSMRKGLKSLQGG